MMEMFAAWTRRRRALTCGLAAAVALLLITVVVVLSTGNGESAHRASPTLSTAPTVAVPSVTPADPSAPPASSTLPALPALARTEDPVAYARAVARALFEVDPAAVSRSEFVQFWRGELPTVVYADAATRGLALLEQNNDVIDNLTSAWIPTQPAWNAEAAQHTSNRFMITSVSVPDYWVNAVAEGTFRDPGLHMERVMGVLTQRYGTNPAERHSTSRSVVIDLGLLCGPTQPGGCRLLAPQQPPALGDNAQD